MLENIVYLSPLIALILGLLRSIFLKQNSSDGIAVFKNCRFFLIISFLLTVIFFNKSMLSALTSANKFTFAFQILLYLSTFATLYLSRKYYKTMKISGSVFYETLLLAIFSGQILIISRNIALTLCGYSLLIISDFLLLKNYSVKRENNLFQRIYITAALLSLTIFLGVTLALQHICHNLDYSAVSSFFDIYKQNITVFIIAAAIILNFIFILGLAPLHFGLTETSANTTLPIYTYFTCIRSCVCWAAFFQLNLKVLSSLGDYFALFYAGVGIFSIIIGALGACSSKNIRKIMAYSSVFHYGISILIMQNFTLNSQIIACIYWFVYMISMYGICINLFSLRIKGDYLVTLNEFSGAAYKKPFSAATFALFLFSLLGFPPFLGFISNFSILNDLVVQGNYIQLLFVVTMLLFLAYAYLQILQTFYFEDGKTSFDRIDWGIYILLSLILIIMIILTIYPQWIFQDLTILLDTSSHV